MANRYWVGGTGTWNTTSTTNWSASSGGASGASVPTYADNVIFDSATTYTVTFSNYQTCADFTVSAGTVTFTGTPTLGIAGSMTLVAGTVFGAAGSVWFVSQTTGKTITTNGVSINSGITFSGVGGEWTLGSALTLSNNRSILVYRGTFNTGNYNITLSGIGQVISTNKNVRSINLGSSTITLADAFDISDSTNLTFNAGTSQITSTSPAGILASGITFYNVSLNSNSSGSVIKLGSTGGSALTFNNLSINAPTTAGVKEIAIATNLTVNGTFTVSAGSSAFFRTALVSDVVGTQRTLTCAAVSSFSDVDFRDIAFAGACISGGNITGTRLGDALGNSNITFPAAKTVYFRATGSANWGATGSWSATSGGAADDTQFPLAQDTAIFPAATYPASGSSVTFNATRYHVGTIDMSLRTTNTMTFSNAGTCQVYKNLITGTGITYIGSGTFSFLGRTTQTVTSAGKTFTQSFSINSPSGSVELADAFSLSRAVSNVLDLVQGTFDTKNFNVTISAGVGGLFSDYTSTRALTLGSSTISVSSGAIALGTTGMTLSAGTSTITFSGAGDITGSGMTLYNVTFSAAASNLSNIGSFTFNNLTLTPPTAAVGLREYQFQGNITVNGTLTITAGTNAFYRTSLTSSVNGTQRTLTCAAVSASLADINFRDIAFAGACISGGNITGTRFGDGGNNSNITFPAAKTVYFRATGSANWVASGSWSATSGGAADDTQFPLAQDTAVFPAATYPASGSTVTMNVARTNIGTIDMSLRTANTMTFAASSTASVLGSFINGTGVTTSGTSIWTFCGTGTQNFTSAGQTITFRLTVNCSGSVVLQDAFTCSGQSFSLQRGTFNANGYNVTFSNSGLVFNCATTNTRTLALGSGTFTFSGVGGGNEFDCSTSTGLTVTGNGTIKMSGAGTKYFYGGGIQTWPTLDNANSGSLVITGANKFADITNSYSATGAATITFSAGVTNEFTSFSATGASGKVLTITSADILDYQVVGLQATLSKPSSWTVGANSIDLGFNTGLTFSGSNPDYLAFGFINGVSTAPPSTGNFLGFFF